MPVIHEKEREVHHGYVMEVEVDGEVGREKITSPSGEVLEARSFAIDARISVGGCDLLLDEARATLVRC